MTLPAREQWYPSQGRDEFGKPEKGVVGRFELRDIEVIPPPPKDGEPPAEPIIKKVPHLICKTTMSPDYVPEKMPLDPIARKAMIDRFPQAWAAFQGEHVEDIGTPLDREFRGMTLPALERQRYEMVGISAWEQIADLSDLGCDQLGFGTKKRRDDVMRAMGRTPPGHVPAISLQFGMTAKDALMAMPGGDKLVAELERKIAEHNGEAAPANAPAAPDLSHPTVQAAIQAAVEAGVKAALAAAAPKRGGWPKGKARGKAAETEAPAADAAAA